ncbi:MAG: ABC transporter ATP-binding protein [Oscillospiraceae bacterium]|jgi:ABC-2 type transport system ATP-binding protein|nr:ABC transporter ATP-binding protein [Oscillospiraceae bacterium]
MNAIEIHGLTKHYDGFSLENVSFTLPMGCILGLAGENGAGKSTTIRCILNAVRPDAGDIHVLGKSNQTDFARTKEDIGVVLDNVGFPNGLTTQQVGKVMSKTYKNWNADRFEQYRKRFDLPEKKCFRDFSRGMKMKLGIAVAMSHDPKLLILDEATSGLDPVIRDEVVELFYEFTRDEQHSILISSHILSDLEKLCDYIAFLQKGKLLLCEEKDELLSRYCLVQGTPEDIYAIDKSKILSEKHTAYGASAILRREDAPKGMQTSPIGMEELFIAMVKGEH